MPQASFNVIDKKKEKKIIIYSLKAELVLMLLESVQLSVQPGIKKTDTMHTEVPTSSK